MTGAAGDTTLTVRALGATGRVAQTRRAKIVVSLCTLLRCEVYFAVFTLVICSEPWKLDRSAVGFSGRSHGLGEGADDDEGIAVFGSAEGVHPEAGSQRHAGGGDLPQGRDQPGDLLQLEEEVRRAAADRDAPAEPEARLPRRSLYARVIAGAAAFA